MIEDVIDSATPLEMGLVNRRPRLFLTPERLAFLRSAVSTPPYDGFFAQVRQFADPRMTPELPDWTKGDVRGHGCVLPHLALMFLLTGDGRYRERTLAMIRKAVDFRRNDFTGGHLLAGMAIAYDWLHESLDAAERKEIADIIFACGTHAFEEAALFKRWTFSILTCNHLPVEMCALTAAGCALYGEKPQTSRWLLLCVEKSRLMAEALGDDGASQEGIGYGQYYNEFFIKTLVLVRDLMGVDLFKDCAYLRLLPLFYLYSSISRDAWTPQASLINFGDGVRYNWYGPDSHLRVLAGYYRDPVAQWLADQHLAAGTAAVSGSFLNLTHYDSTLPPQAPDPLPLSHHFADKDLVYQRSGWKTGETVVAFRCGPHFGHRVLHRYTGEIGGGHMQANNGTIYLIAGGDYLLSGDGYFRKLTEYGNTLRLNGQGQVGEGGAWFESLSMRQHPRGAHILATGRAGECEYTIGNLAPAYSENLGIRRLSRKLLRIGPLTWVVVDEIDTEEPVSAEVRFHSDFPFTSAGLSWLAQGKAFALRLTSRGTAEWTATTGLQPFAYVDGKVTRQYHLLKLETGSCRRSALVSLLEVLPTSGLSDPAPGLRVDGNSVDLDLWLSGNRKKLRVNTLLDDPTAPGIEMK